MDRYYEHYSISKNDPKRYSPNALIERVRVKFIEAENYRKVFSATTWNRLKYVERMSNNNAGLLSAFSENVPKQILQNLVMVDFYRSIPTMVLCVAEKIGARLASSLIREMEEKQMLVRQDHLNDKRVKIIFPTVKMVQEYEAVSAQWDYMRIAAEGRLHNSEHIKELVYFDSLRKKYLPPNIYKGVSFNLIDVMDEEEFAISNPMLKVIK